MLDIGMPELILVFIVILIVFGPGKIPEFSKALGRGIREIKIALRGVKESVEEAVSQGEQDITGMSQPDIPSKGWKTGNTTDQKETDKSAESDDKKEKAVDG